MEFCIIENAEGISDLSVVSALGVETKENVKGKMVDLSGYKQGVYAVLFHVNGQVIKSRIVIE